MSEHDEATDPQRTHWLRRASGRDPHEHGRTATTLELLYDLVFVVAIGLNRFGNRRGRLA